LNMEKVEKYSLLNKGKKSCTNNINMVNLYMKVF